MEIPIYLIVAEAVSVAIAFVTNYLLAKKIKAAWLTYALGGIIVVYIFIEKNVAITAINQSMMIVLGFKNYFLYEHKSNKWFSRIDWLSVPVFLASWFLFEGWTFKNVVEIGMWFLIIGKTVALGQGMTNGWLLHILTQTFSTAFGLYQQMYIYTFRAVFMLFQGIYGYFLWKKDA